MFSKCNFFFYFLIFSAYYLVCMLCYAFPIWARYLHIMWYLYKFTDHMQDCIKKIGYIFDYRSWNWDLKYILHFQIVYLDIFIKLTILIKWWSFATIVWNYWKIFHNLDAHMWFSIKKFTTHFNLIYQKHLSYKMKQTNTQTTKHWSQQNHNKLNIFISLIMKSP